MIVFVAVKIKNIKFFSKFIWMKNRFECHEKIESTQLSETNILIISSSPGWIRTDMGGPKINRSVENRNRY